MCVPGATEKDLCEQSDPRPDKKKNHQQVLWRIKQRDSQRRT
jgi:hypothetical protein